jgi:hypothetical protein
VVSNGRREFWMETRDLLFFLLVRYCVRAFTKLLHPQENMHGALLRNTTPRGTSLKWNRALSGSDSCVSFACLLLRWTNKRTNERTNERHERKKDGKTIPADAS